MAAEQEVRPFVGSMRQSVLTEDEQVDLADSILRRSRLIAAQQAASGSTVGVN